MSQSKCATPGAVYETMIRSTFIRVRVGFPLINELSPVDAAKLEAELHDALEKVLAPYWPKSGLANLDVVT